jgi:hypothetical protein
MRLPHQSELVSTSQRMPWACMYPYLAVHGMSCKAGDACCCSEKSKVNARQVSTADTDVANLAPKVDLQELIVCGKIFWAGSLRIMSGSSATPQPNDPEGTGATRAPLRAGVSPSARPGCHSGGLTPLLMCFRCICMGLRLRSLNMVCEVFATCC